MPGPDFHPDLRAARYLPRSTVGPRRLRLVRWLIARQKQNSKANAVVAVAGTQVPVRVYRPAGPTRRRPGLLWIHGGGLVVGSAAMEDTTCRALADRLDIVIVAVDYRLAPEHPYPTALQDCHSGLCWLAALPEVDANRIAVGGASAGGGLAAALALLSHERGDFDPVLQVLVYPMLDDRTSVRTDIDRRGLRLWGRSDTRFGWQSYLGSAAFGDDVPAMAAPARQVDLAGLPPAWIGVGTNDLFYDEAVSYAARLQQAGVPCTLEVVPGAYHGFDRIEAKTPVAKAFFEAQVAALDNAFNGTRSAS